MNLTINEHYLSRVNGKVIDMKKTGSFKRLKIENSKKGDDRETRSIIK